MGETLARKSRIGIWSWWGIVIGYACASSALGLWLAARDIAVVDTVDKYLGDFRTALFSPRAAAQRADIAVVLIGETTLLDYDVRSPISGRLLGKVIEGIDRAGPKAIGLDFIFDRRTPYSAEFLAATKRVKSPLVLGAVDDRISGLPKESLETQAEILAAIGRPVGHLLLEHKAGLLATGNDTIRYVAGPYRGLLRRDSLASMLARAAKYNHEPANRLIAWQLEPTDTSQPLFLTLTVPRHPQDGVGGHTGAVVPDAWAELLHDRVVLVGANMVDRDQHTTPLSVIDGRRVPGVMIHAQALAQRLDGSTGHSRDIRALPIWSTFLFVTLVALVCFAAGRRYRSGTHKKVLGALGLCLIGVVSVLAFWLWQVDLPSGALALAWVAGTVGGNYGDWVLSWLGSRLAGDVSAGI